jgi:UDP-3-O-[3-hydroxymyristoyl] glucosamine N-acyltransferase
MAHTVSDIAAALNARAEGAVERRLRRPAHPAEAGPDDLAVAFDAAHAARLGEGAARVAVLAEGADWRALGLDAAIFVGRPRYALAGLTERFAPPCDIAPGVHPLAFVDPAAELGEAVRIGPFVTVGAGARIGPRTVLAAHASLGADARIGADGFVGEGVRIGRGVTIGDRVVLQPNAVIGSDGFSYVTPQPGAVESVEATGRVAEDARNMRFARIHSLAAVTLGDDVEIGAGATIDAGTLSDTRIGSGTKIDNLVQIGHNVKVGETCLICAQTGIAGSTRIGDRVVLGGQTGVADHVIIGSDVVIGAKSGVAANAPDGAVLLGTPALPREETLRIMLELRRLPRLVETVARLKKRLSALESNR